VAVKQDSRGDVVALTRTTTCSCHDPETVVSNFWWPGGVRGSPQRVPSAGSGGRRLLLLPPSLLLLRVGKVVVSNYLLLINQGLNQTSATVA